MDRKTVTGIIKEEHLVSFNLFEDRDDFSDEVVIKNVSGKWVVYATNERANIISGSKTIFTNEEDALDNFLRRVRALNRVINSR